MKGISAPVQGVGAKCFPTESARGYCLANHSLDKGMAIQAPVASQTPLRPALGRTFPLVRRKPTQSVQPPPLLEGGRAGRNQDKLVLF